MNTYHSFIDTFPSLDVDPWTKPGSDEPLCTLQKSNIRQQTQSMNRKCITKKSRFSILQRLSTSHCSWLLWRRCCLCDLHIFNKNAASRAAINRYLPPGGLTAAINDISRPADSQQQSTISPARRAHCSKLCRILCKQCRQRHSH